MASEGSNRRPTGGRRLGLRLAGFVRWLHTYLSMFSLAALLFFSLTGITLNHPRLFFDGVATSVEAEGQLDADWVGEGPEDRVKKLEVVEQLRKDHGIRGALSSFTIDDEECVVTFKGPAYSADAFIQRADGRYRVIEDRQGLIAVLNDLHKGRDTGPVWSAVIDISAALTALVSVTGLLLLFYIKRRRTAGLLMALVGTVLLMVAFLMGVR
ncbi:PepSY-associated TM helix domain-containing protein (plasmid) [Tundrisphaera lichenicola]|uniref:PepSY-associated TM helix domain-containing protein n=1 Tax=Tundrisphaera lichenicola TaxID=2029860 RepID=UPI003EC13F4B